MARRAMKPNKAIAKRFKVTKTGKLKRHHGFTSHLMSSRPAHRRRKLRMAAILPESHARRLRALMGIFKSPGKLASARKLAAKQAALAEAAAAADTTVASA
ncbi:MAG: Ribosomal protein [Phycisphaerales bacterium]|nr:Ribosomal protein [Phycisphaerales bacterium]